MRKAKIQEVLAMTFVLAVVVSFATTGIALAKDEHEKATGTLRTILDKGLDSPKGEHDKPPAKAKPKAKEHHVAAASGHDVAGISADEAMKKLTEGNRRYAAGKTRNPGRTVERRAEVAQEQHPFAVIVSCSDSRVPPEVIFDQGVGDLFVVRTAGHVAENAAIGSIEYAVEHLGAKLIVVLGHKRCGAVDATVKGGEAPGHIKDIVEAIKPAVERAKAKHGDLLDNAVKANAKMVAQTLSSSKPILAEMVEDGMVKVVGGYYDLDSGAVSITYNPH